MNLELTVCNFDDCYAIIRIKVSKQELDTIDKKRIIRGSVTMTQPDTLIRVTMNDKDDKEISTWTYPQAEAEILPDKVPDQTKYIRITVYQRQKT